MEICSISQSLVNSAASKYFLTFWICVSVSKYFFTLFGSSHPVHVFVWQPCPVQVTSFPGPLNPHHNFVLNLNKVFKMFKYLEYLFLDPKPTEMCVLCLNILGWSTLATLAAAPATSFNLNSSEYFPTPKKSVSEHAVRQQRVCTLQGEIGHWQIKGSNESEPAH